MRRHLRSLLLPSFAGYGVDTSKVRALRNGRRHESSPPAKRGERKGPSAKRGGGEVGGCDTIDVWMEIDRLAGTNP